MLPTPGPRPSLRPPRFRSRGRRRVPPDHPAYRGKAGIRGKACLRAALEKLLLAEPFFEPFPATTKGLVNGLRRRSQPPLQDRQREADRAFAAFVLQGLGPVEFLADVIGDLLVEVGFGIGQVIVHRVGDPLGEQWGAVELEEILLDQPPHHVRRHRWYGHHRGTCPRNGPHPARP